MNAQLTRCEARVRELEARVAELEKQQDTTAMEAREAAERREWGPYEYPEDDDWP